MNEQPTQAPKLETPEQHTKPVKKAVDSLVVQYVFFTIIFTMVIGVFSLIMSAIAQDRNEIAYRNYSGTAEMYGGPLAQSAPSLGMLDTKSSLYVENDLSYEVAKRYVENTSLKSTDADVTITADFVKKGLVYQPTFKTSFKSVYLLKNELNEESLIKFQFPFPGNITSQEISNATLLVNGEEVSNAKSQITLNPTTPQYDYNYNYNYNYNNSQYDGLSWEGKIPAGEDVDVEVRYETVGVSSFNYEGIENPKGSQDFKFKVTINGTRSYDVNDGLSVSDREFGDGAVSLYWDKPDLYSKPKVSITVGDKLNPSAQVSRVYLTMAPVYFVFIIITLYLAYRFGKRKLSLFDMLLVTILFTLYFPFVHYLSSFTIDPTIELFSNFSKVPNFSMPLYGAFLIAVLVIGGLMYYLLGRIAGFKFSSKFVIPEMILALGFFPLVVTIPEYSMLLVIVGVIALMAIIIQTRVKMLRD
jgi:hypothetical protein